MSKQAFLDILKFFTKFLETHQTDEIWVTALKLISAHARETRDHIIMTTTSTNRDMIRNAVDAGQPSESRSQS